MPHNLYLHSALVQTRRIGTTAAERRTACRFNLIDSAVALNGALLVNAAILVLAAAVFYKRGIVVKEIQQAYLLLTPLLGTAAASVVFALALLASGQSSTLTGTMAGQVVMEGFLNFRMRPWLRRLITRMLAVTPAALTIYIAGDQGTFRLLILSQVILSMQLAVRRDSADPFHQRPRPHGRIRQPAVGPAAGLDHRGRHRRPEHRPDLSEHRRPGGGRARASFPDPRRSPCRCAPACWCCWAW